MLCFFSILWNGVDTLPKAAIKTNWEHVWWFACSALRLVGIEACEFVNDIPYFILTKGLKFLEDFIYLANYYKGLKYKGGIFFIFWKQIFGFWASHPCKGVQSKWDHAWTAVSTYQISLAGLGLGIVSRYQFDSWPIRKHSVTLYKRELQ